MKKLLLLFALTATCFIISSFCNNIHYMDLESENGNEYIYYTSVTAWTGATESTTIYIYYKEGNGIRKYYTSCGDTKSMSCLTFVGKNKLYKSDACNDFRYNYQYMAGYHRYFFNCNLPYFTESADDDGYKFYTSVKAWDAPTESTILYIYYKEGNGVRKYYSSCGDEPDSKNCYLFVKRNKYYNNMECNDYRRKYHFTASTHDYYFNCDLPYFTE